MSNMIDMKVQLRGMYKIEAVDMLTGRVRVLADWFPNLITDNGLELFAVGNYLTYCSVGSGSTTPANANTTLVTFVGQSSSQITTTQTMASSSPYSGTYSVTYQFAAGVATGNLAEVGVGPSTGGTNLFSRALILDGGGSPTTITVLSSEALNVTYQLQLFSPTTDVTGNVTIAGTSYAYTLRAADVTTAGTWCISSNQGAAGPASIQVGNGTIGAITSHPSSLGFTASAVTPAAYVAASHQRDTVFTFSLATGNVSGGLITCAQFNCGISFNGLGTFQVGFSPGIPKDNSHVLTLTFRHTWGRYP